ncbi:MAG TPA: hypothetical protein VFE65_15600 [Pseudonocardia sp.]|nr:hypothetical protein [Pseudonocardia sp.]
MAEWQRSEPGGCVGRLDELDGGAAPDGAAEPDDGEVEGGALDGSEELLGPVSVVAGGPCRSTGGCGAEPAHPELSTPMTTAQPANAATPPTLGRWRAGAVLLTCPFLPGPDEPPHDQVASA